MLSYELRNVKIAQEGFILLRFMCSHDFHNYIDFEKKKICSRSTLKGLLSVLRFGTFMHVSFRRNFFFDVQFNAKLSLTRLL